MELSPIVIEILDAQSAQTKRCNYQVFFRTGRVWMVEVKIYLNNQYIVLYSKQKLSMTSHWPLTVKSCLIITCICIEYEWRLALIYLLLEAADLLILSPKLMLD